MQGRPSDLLGAGTSLADRVASSRRGASSLPVEPPEPDQRPGLNQYPGPPSTSLLQVVAVGEGGLQRRLQALQRFGRLRRQPEGVAPRAVAEVAELAERDGEGRDGRAGAPKGGQDGRELFLASEWYRGDCSAASSGGSAGRAGGGSPGSAPTRLLCGTMATAVWCLFTGKLGSSDQDRLAGER
jgi:hypothetical protein